MRRPARGDAIGAAARLACLTYPRRFRRRFAHDIGLTLSSRHTRQAADNGTVRAALTTTGALVRLAASGLLERLGGGPRGSALPPQVPEAMLNTLFQDLRQAGRIMRLNPLTTAVALLTLALGTGVNTAIFSVVDTVLVRPLPYEQPERLVAVQSTNGGNSWWSSSLADLLELRELSAALESVALTRPASFGVILGGEPETVSGARVTANYFDLLGVGADQGRGFVAGEDREGAARVAVLSHGFHMRRFGLDPDVLGSTLRIDGEEATVVGILPRFFSDSVLADPELYVTRRFTPDDALERARIYRLVGRLAPGYSLASASEEVAQVAAAIEQRHPEAMAGWGTQLIPLRSAITASSAAMLWSLTAAVGLILLVACVNVANLLLARGTSRRHELTIRQALGARRSRLIRQLLTESALLGLLGGGLGLLLAAAASRPLLAQSAAVLPIAPADGLDLRVLGFTLALSLASCMLFGLLPALRTSRTEANGSLETRRHTAAPGHRRVGHLLVAAEVALIVVLLIGAALVLQSFGALLGVDAGFDPGGKLVANITLPTAFGADEIPRIRTFYGELIERIEASPGVASAADATNLPLVARAGFTAFHLIQGRPASAPGEEPMGGVEVVSSGYFTTMDMEILAGRGFDAGDRPETAPVVVVNETFARLYWPDADPLQAPLGESVSLGPAANGQTVALGREIVGIVRGVRYGLDQQIRPRVYLPDSQSPMPMTARDIVVQAGPGLDPASLSSTLRAAVAAVEPTQPVAWTLSYEQVAARSLSSQRLQATLLAVFAAVGLLLGAVGVYAVVSYSVSQQTREMGIRLALGARPTRVRAEVLKTAMTPVVAGTIVGLVAAWMLSGIVSGLLFGIEPTDAATFAAIPALLGLVALAASLLPAQRATRVDPVRSLRAE